MIEMHAEVLNGTRKSRVLHPINCKGCKARGLQTLCNRLEGGDRAHMRSLAKGIHINEGSILVYENDQLDYVYYIVEGFLKSYRELLDGRLQIVGFCGAGDFLSLPDERTASCTVETLSAVEACYFRYTDFVSLLELYPVLKSCLLTMANAQISVQREQLLALGRKTPSEKLAWFFLILAQRQSPVGNKPMTIELPMKQIDIADYLGLTAETVSRTTSKLRELGLIGSILSNRLTLLQPARLGRLANLAGPPTKHLALCF